MKREEREGRKKRKNEEGREFEDDETFVFTFFDYAEHICLSVG